MSDILDLSVYGDASSCRAAATEASTASDALSTAASQMTAARAAAASAWSGTAAEHFGDRVTTTRSDLEELQRRLRSTELAMDAFAGELDVVESLLADARATVSAAGLPVSGDKVTMPAMPGDNATDAQVSRHNAKIVAWNAAVATVDDARVKENSAHSSLDEALQSAAGDGWLETLLEKLGFAPPDNLGNTGTALWGAGLTGLGLGFASDWMIKGRYGVFQPRINGRFASPNAFSRWQRGLMSGTESNWHALPNAAGTRGAWQAAGKAVKIGGAAVSFGTAAWSQWEQDADDPSLDQTAKVTRSVTVGATSAAGAWVGAEGGAYVGGAIGTMICPGVGTVVGGALGGIIGGFAGSEIGGMVGDSLKDATGDAADAVSDFVGDAGSTVGHAASDVGDALSFWD